MNNIKSIVGFFMLIVAAIAGALWYQVTFTPITIKMDLLSKKENIVPIAIIGSGPAGLNAAVYGARSSLYTVVFQGKTPGGQLTGTTYVENWPGITKKLGSQLVEDNQKQAEKFGALMVPDSIASVDFSSWPYTLKTEEGHEITALSVILATGSNPRLLNDTATVPGEKEYWGYGVTTCAVCDAPFYKGKNVVVVGGGDSAVEEATLITAYADKVTMLVRGPKMRAAAAMQDRLKDYPKISVLYATKITEILGDGSVVTGVRLRDNKAKRTYDMKTDGVFLAIGHTPNTDLFKKWVSLNGSGYIALPARLQATNVPGVFAAGDVADHKYRQAGVAAGDGIKAALEAIEFLQDHGLTNQLAKKLEKSYYDPTPESELVELDKIVTSYDFDRLSYTHPWIVADVGAEHCASCKTLTPIVRSVATKLADKAKFIYIDMGDDPKDLIRRFNLKALPSILVFHKGELVARSDQQLFTKRELHAFINKVMAEKS